MVSIHLLRGFAALLVLLYHYAHYLAHPPSWWGEGYAGVDIFFVISGFVIAYSTAGWGRGDTGRFLWRRFWRVVPLAELVTLAYWWCEAARPGPSVLWHSVAFLPQAPIDPPVLGAPVVTQEWTLRYEFAFYLIFAGALAVAPRWRSLLTGAFLVTAVLGLQVAFLGAVTLRARELAPAPTLSATAATCLDFAASPVLLEFVVGLVLAALYRRWEARIRTPRTRAAARLLALVSCGIFIWSLVPGHNPGYGLCGKGAGAAALVIAGLLWEASGRMPRPPRWAWWFGSISYALYLVHAGLAERMLRFAARHTWQRPVTGLPAIVLLTLVSLLVASILHVTIERPLVRWATGRARVRSAHR